MVKPPAKVPLCAPKRPAKRKTKDKDKPKRPLSAYNFFFKAEREKILKAVSGNLDDDFKNDPDSDDFINKETIDRLKKEDGKVSFEEMGKLIGQRWKSISPERLSVFTKKASGDTERYKSEMQTYNGQQEAKLRTEAKTVTPVPSRPVASIENHSGGELQGIGMEDTAHSMSNSRFYPERTPNMSGMPSQMGPPHRAAMGGSAGYGGMYGNNMGYSEYGGMGEVTGAGMGMGMGMNPYGAMGRFGGGGGAAGGNGVGYGGLGQGAGSSLGGMGSMMGRGSDLMRQDNSGGFGRGGMYGSQMGQGGMDMMDPRFQGMMGFGSGGADYGGSYPADRGAHGSNHGWGY